MLAGIMVSLQWYCFPPTPPSHQLHSIGGASSMLAIDPPTLDLPDCGHGANHHFVYSEACALCLVLLWEMRWGDFMRWDHPAAVSKQISSLSMHLSSCIKHHAFLGTILVWGPFRMLEESHNQDHVKLSTRVP